MSNASKAQSSVASASRAVAEAYLYTLQNIAQGVNNNQIVAINCNNDVTNQLCVDCLETVQKVKEDRGENVDVLVDLCDTCKCEISNINLSQNITVDFSAAQTAAAAQHFSSAVQNSLTNQTYQQSGSLDLQNRADTITNVSNDIYTRLSSSTFQDSLQQLKNIQTVVLNSPGSLTNVDVEQAVNFVSDIVQNSEQTADLVSQLQTEVLNASTQITVSGLNQVIIGLILIGVGGFVLLLIYGIISQGLSLLGTASK